MANNLITNLSMYKDKKGRNIYYDFFTKRGYYVKDINDKRIFLFQNRYILAIIVFGLILSFFKSAIISLIISLVIYITLEINFRLRILPNYTYINNFKSSNSYSNAHILNEKKTRPWAYKLRFALLVSIAILLIVNALELKFDNFNLIATIIVAIAIVIIAIKHLLEYLLAK